MARALYIDEDAANDIAAHLRGFGHDAVSTAEVGNKGNTDAKQLGYAVRTGRIVVTCNRRDFLTLHEAWLLAFHVAGHTGGKTHSGIFIIPNGSEVDARTAALAIDAFLRSEPDVDDRLWRWQPSVGWQLMDQEQR